MGSDIWRGEDLDLEISSRLLELFSLFHNLACVILAALFSRQTGIMHTQSLNQVIEHDPFTVLSEGYGQYNYPVQYYCTGIYLLIWKQVTHNASYSLTVLNVM